LGALNIEETRIPYATGEKKVGHNPIQKVEFLQILLEQNLLMIIMINFFLYQKCDKKKEDFNFHLP